MADHAGQEPSPEFMKDHLRAWSGFLKLIKWLVIGSVLLLIVLLIWRTHNG